MNILLVNPPNCGRSIPEERYGITSMKQIFRGEPLALEVLAGNLDGHELHIVDLKVEPDGLQPAISSFSPDLVVLTAMTCEAQTVRKLAVQIKEMCDATTVVGGVHASSDPEFFNVAQIDWIVVGLGWRSLRELVECLEKGGDVAVPGVAGTCPGKALCYQPRMFSGDDLPVYKAPRYDLVDRYRPAYTLEKLGLELGFVVSAAGCPYNCSFCSIAPLTGGKYLTGAIPAVIRDIQTLATPVIRLVDANSFGNVKHAAALADAIERAGIRKQFLADVRSDTVVDHPQLLRRWKEIGLRAVVIGFEELDDSALGSMEKQNSATNNLRAIEILHDIGLTIVGDFIISPDYTEEQFDLLGNSVSAQAIELPMYTVLTPLPGTPLYRRLKEKITIHDLDYYTLLNAVLPTRLPEEVFYSRYASLIKEGHTAPKV